jgi:hypothetical protein
MGGHPKFQFIVSDGLIKVAHCQIVFWDVSQLIKLINMVHNKYQSSCESLGQNGNEQR